VIVGANELIDEVLAEQIETAGVDECSGAFCSDMRRAKQRYLREMLWP
jgi:hypothetical protein